MVMLVAMIELPQGQEDECRGALLQWTAGQGWKCSIGTMVPQCPECREIMEYDPQLDAHVCRRHDEQAFDETAGG